MIDSKTITGCLSIRAANVVIRNSSIAAQCFTVVHVYSGNLTIEDSTVDCIGYRGHGIAYGHFVAKRVEVKRCENGFDVSGGYVRIEDSLISDVREVGGGHGDGIQIYITSGHLESITIKHNTFDLRNPITSSIIFDGAPAKNMLVEDNFFAAGAYTVYTPSSLGNVIFRNNRFYGPVGNWPSDTHRPAYGFYTTKNGLTWTGNFRDDTLATI